MKKILLVSLVILLVGMLSVCGWGEEKIKIGIVQLVDHPALNSTRDGVIDALLEVYGYIPAKTSSMTFSRRRGICPPPIPLLRNLFLKKWI